MSLRMEASSTPRYDPWHNDGRSLAHHVLKKCFRILNPDPVPCIPMSTLVVSSHPLTFTFDVDPDPNTEMGSSTLTLEPHPITTAEGGLGRPASTTSPGE